jgi:hypothetical protein
MDPQFPVCANARKMDRHALAALPVLVALLTAALPSGPASGDAIVRTQAMLASTIAEYRIENDHVRLDLEISLADLRGFANLLPDGVREEMGLPERPLAERVETFFERDLVISAEGGPPLPGRIVEIGPQPRVKRDEFTGEPLPPNPEEPAETAVFAQLEYKFSGRPRTLTLFGLRGEQPVSVGFVAYHRGVAVNDFRYMAPSQTLTLDWDDPWYTSFERRALRRQYFAPMSGFLYIEPYEVRKEIILRPLDLQRWVDLGLDGQTLIAAEQQPEIARTIGEFLRDRHRVRVDGVEIPPELVRVNFLERTLRTSRVVEPGTDLDVFQAVVGAIYVYATDGLPERATMEWDLWDERIPRVPVSAVDQAGGMPDVLEPDRRILEWQNFLKFPEMPTLERLAEPPNPWTRAMGFGRWIVLCLAAAGAALLASRRPRAWQALLVGLAFLAAAAFWLGQRATLSEEATASVVSGLLHNIYRAFDYRSEERIYDALAVSTAGAVLEQTYLETRKGLELASQGGARARVKTVDLVELASVTPADDGGFRADATWNVAGAVGHWGHVHERRNQYQAKLTIAPVEGTWKLTGLEIVREERR